MAISTSLSRPAVAREIGVGLGYVGILSSPMLAFGMLASQAGQVQLGEGLMLIFLLGWMGGMVALGRSGALGTGRFAKAGFAIHLAFLFSATIWQLTQAIHPGMGEGTFAFAVGNMSWPIAVNGMTLIGIGVIAAHRWQGWTRFTPLACGLCFPLGMAAQEFLGSTWGMLFGALTAYAWSGFSLSALLASRRLSQEPNAA
ncbi:MAG: hypothetical protein ACO1SV_25855 [Fimbriimonas sp.]